MSLNARERQVLRLVAEGRRDKEIARELHRSPDAIRQTVCRAIWKLGANTRSQAVAMLIREEI